MITSPITDTSQGILNQLPPFDSVQWPDRCRIWIYVSNRPFETHEQIELAERLSEFAANWSAHKLRLTAYSMVFMNQVIVLGVDEQVQAISGCSIDASVHFVKDFEFKWGVVLLDGGRLARYDGGCLRVESLAQARQNVALGVINPRTWFFNSFAQNATQLRSDTWMQANSGLFARMLGF
ncbi:MAG: hypothetical protein FJ344_01645 [Sphingomonadales bacterium]|nr:hypothetical protein [Sphingomonadales bacterium]